MADTDKLKTEYVETYNRYMTLPDDSKELKTLAKKLHDMEQTLTRRFLFESGYATEKIKEMSRDADSAEERELINKFMSKLQNIR